MLGASTHRKRSGECGTEQAAIKDRRTLRITIFGINYAPELTGIGPYTAEFAEHLARQGHRVDVVTGIPHYPEWRRMPATSQAVLNPLVHRHWHYIPRRAGVVGRTWYEISWLVTACRSALTCRADVAIGVVPSLSGAALAVLAGRSRRISVGLVVQDLMGPAAAQSGYKGGLVVAGLTTYLERLLLRRSDRVAIVSEGFRPHLVRSGVPSERIHSVRNWTHPGVPTESAEECRRRLGWGPSQFVCLHSGNMGQKQDLDTVLEAAKLLEGEDIAVVLAGEGNDRSRLMQRVNREHLRNVAFVDLQSPGKYESMLSAADVLLINQRASVVEMSLPSKLAAYFVSGRRVIASVALGCETAREIRAAGAGLVVPAADPRGLAQAILEIRASPQRGSSFGKAARDYAESHLSSTAALKIYDDFLACLTSDVMPETKTSGAPLADLDAIASKGASETNATP